MSARTLRHLGSALLLALLLPASGRSQPFGTPAGSLSANTGDSFVEIPNSPDLNPSGQITIELWTRLVADSSCRSLVGKGYVGSYWVGICNGVVRSYLKGSTSKRDGGQLPLSLNPHHIAVTYDGTARKHYIDGELVAVFPETGSLPSSSQPLRIFGDVNFAGHTPVKASIFEVRLWSVARTKSQIRQTIGQELNAPVAGLVAVWHLRDDATDAIGGHHGGAPQGNAHFGQHSPLPCVAAGDESVCLGSFSVSADYQVFGLPAADGHVTLVSSGGGRVVPGASADSALFWFFGPNNWELMVKKLDACIVNNRFWVFSAATTDQHYALTVTDMSTGTVKQYINYAGPPAPAVTDTSAFATCP